MGDLAGEARRHPEPCTDDTGQHCCEESFATVVEPSLLSSRSGRRLARRAPRLFGSDAGVRSPWAEIKRAARLSTSSSARLDRCGSGGGGGGGGGGGAVVEMLQVQFIDKMVDILMQLKFQQSRARASSTECWTFQLHSERVRTVQTVQETVFRVGLHVINSDKSLQSEVRFEILRVADLCCAAEYRRNSTGAVLGCLGGC